MSLSVDPGAVQDAARNLTNLQGYLEDAYDGALANTTAILPAGSDEVSVALSNLFNLHGAEFHSIAAAAQSFHKEFTQGLALAKEAYETTDWAGGNLLQKAVNVSEQLIVPLLQNKGVLSIPSQGAPVSSPPPGVNPVALLFGGTQWPTLTQATVNIVDGKFLNNLPVYNGFTPEQLFPGSPQLASGPSSEGLGPLTLNQSVALGIKDMNSAIMSSITGGHHTTVGSISQSAIVATGEIKYLMTHGSPDTNMLNFVLTGDPNNPNGGFFERYTGAYMPGMSATFSGATPPNSPYLTQVFTAQYDGVSDAPQYPLNVISDLNSFMGFIYVHGQAYTQPGFAFLQLPTSPGYTGNTTYYMALTQNLPLLDPLRGLGVQGNAFADLLQPDLRVICDMGYGTNEYANIPTPASLISIPNLPVIAHDLTTGLRQGAQAFAIDEGWLHASIPDAYPFIPELNPGLHVPLPQHSVTGLSQLMGLDGKVFTALGFPTGE
jgi:hypothetical protein